MLKITWLGHGTFELQLASGEVIVLDPWIDGNPSYPQGHQFSRVDVIAVTHGHFDHIHDVLPLAKRYGAKIIANFEICTWLESKGARNTSAMNKGGSQAASAVTFTMTHALHSSGIADDGKMLYGGEAAGYVLTFPDGRRAYFAGDTAVFSDMALIAELYQPQLAFLPIGDLFTMSPQEAALACRLLKPETVIPMHYGTFPPLVGRPEQLAELIRNLPGTRVWTLTAGETVTW